MKKKYTLLIILILSTQVFCYETVYVPLSNMSGKQRIVRTTSLSGTALSHVEPESFPNNNYKQNVSLLPGKENYLYIAKPELPGKKYEWWQFKLPEGTYKIEIDTGLTKDYPPNLFVSINTCDTPKGVTLGKPDTILNKTSLTKYFKLSNLANIMPTTPSSSDKTQIQIRSQKYQHVYIQTNKYIYSSYKNPGSWARFEIPPNPDPNIDRKFSLINNTQLSIETPNHPTQTIRATILDPSINIYNGTNKRLYYKLSNNTFPSPLAKPAANEKQMYLDGSEHTKINPSGYKYIYITGRPGEWGQYLVPPSGSYFYLSGNAGSTTETKPGEQYSKDISGKRFDSSITIYNNIKKSKIVRLSNNTTIQPTPLTQEKQQLLGYKKTLTVDHRNYKYIYLTNADKAGKPQQNYWVRFSMPQFKATPTTNKQINKFFISEYYLAVISLIDGTKKSVRGTPLNKQK